jgi:uncharacterized membrane protein
MTVLLLILAAFLFSLNCWRTSHREHTSSVRRVPMFVASVALFDMMLFVANVAIGDFITGLHLSPLAFGDGLLKGSAWAGVPR